MMKKQVIRLTNTIKVRRIATILSCSAVFSSLKLPIVYFQIVQILALTGKASIIIYTFKDSLPKHFIWYFFCSLYCFTSQVIECFYPSFPCHHMNCMKFLFWYIGRKKDIQRLTLTDILLSICCHLYNPSLVEFHRCFKDVFCPIIQEIEVLYRSAVRDNAFPYFVGVFSEILEDIFKIFVLK